MPKMIVRCGLLAFCLFVPVSGIASALCAVAPHGESGRNSIGYYRKSLPVAQAYGYLPENWTPDYVIWSTRTKRIKAHGSEVIPCTQRDIENGGTLEFQMGPRPNKKWGSAPDDAPPSMSDYKY